jgi:aspartyl-tRNA(Asn)/glutamyl-tRNA(Gln) amidotransferase subunit A
VPLPRIPDWTALDDAARRRRRQAARPRARALDPVLNAFVQISLAPASLPPADGIGGLPYAAKDMLQTPLHRPSGGLADGCFPRITGNCDLLDRVAAAGGDLIGFANMTELAYEPSGFNAARGRVRNPWNLDCISGGSSSGSAAAVASGTVVAALGSDTGGSLRIPAHACGITAWMPTHGLVSAHGAMPLAPTLDTLGLLARSAQDMTMLIPVMAQPPRPARIDRATVARDVVAECDPAIRRAMALAIDAIADADVAIEHRPALAAVEAIDRHALIVLQGESARVHRAWIDDVSLSPVLRHRLAKGLKISEEALAGSIAKRAILAADFEDQVLAANDAVILPIMPIPTPSATECDPTSERFSARTLYALSRFTRFVNMLGFPAVALPAGFDDRGMPVGLQIVGRAGSDLALLDLVRRVQSKTDWHGRVPAAIADLVPRPELAS